MPGSIFPFRAGVQIESFFTKKRLDAPPSVNKLSLCIITSSQLSSFAAFMFITLPSNDVDLISHLPHLISSHTDTLNGFH